MRSVPLPLPVTPLLRWPAPALFGWLAGWASYLAALAASASSGTALALASVVGASLALTQPTPMRRMIVGAGFPLSLAASGAAFMLPAWGWLIPLLVLAGLYPMRTWRDAPLFPTPPCALDGLARAAPLPRRARVLDAGSGLGDGLRALRAAYPHAELEGIEWSRAIAWASRRRLRAAGTNASVTRGDMWSADWRGRDLVYLFQRPESLPRAVEKARRELAHGAWLASLEFEALELAADAVLQPPGARPVWLYRAPFRAKAAGPSAELPPVANALPALTNERLSRPRRRR